MQDHKGHHPVAITGLSNLLGKEEKAELYMAIQKMLKLDEDYNLAAFEEIESWMDPAEVCHELTAIAGILRRLKTGKQDAERLQLDNYIFTLRKVADIFTEKK